MMVQRFAGHISYQLIRDASGLLRVLKSVCREATQLLEDEPFLLPSVVILSPLQLAPCFCPAVALAERVLNDALGGLHHHCTYPVHSNTAGKKRMMMRECALCRDEGQDRKLVGTYCLECKVSLCYPSKWKSDRDCFEGQYKTKGYCLILVFSIHTVIGKLFISFLFFFGAFNHAILFELTVMAYEIIV